MMPIAWQNKFRGSYNRLVNYTPLELAVYMTTLSSIKVTSRSSLSSNPLHRNNDRLGSQRGGGGRGHDHNDSGSNHQGRGNNNRRGRETNHDSNPRYRCLGNGDCI
jgi:hypothetical protein